MNKDQLLEELAAKSQTTAKTLHKITSVDSTAVHDLHYAWLMAASMDDYAFHTIKDAETNDAITQALKDGAIVNSGDKNFDWATGTEGEKLVLSA